MSETAKSLVLELKAIRGDAKVISALESALATGDAEFIAAAMRYAVDTLPAKAKRKLQIKADAVAAAEAMNWRYGFRARLHPSGEVAPGSTEVIELIDKGAESFISISGPSPNAIYTALLRWMSQRGNTSGIAWAQLGSKDQNEPFLANKTAVEQGEV